MPRRSTGVLWLVSLLTVALIGSAVALGLAAYRPAHSDIWLAVLSFATSALAVMILLTARGPSSKRPRTPVPAQLPVPLDQFRGRQSELGHLTNRYQRSASALRRTGPTILLIEGMPGVGKTALAQAFAHRLVNRGNFPDGQLYANLGFAGGPRPPADVLHDFLTALGVPGDEIPPDTAERSKLFRSLTADRRLLVLLDAVRGNDQIPPLLPVGSRCAVIITRRSSIGPVQGAAGYLIKPLGTASSLEVLAAFLRSDPIEAAAEAAEIVDYSGGSPLALRSAGQQIADGHFTLRTMASELANPASRLTAFRYQDRDIGERIESEYEKLMPEEQRALQMLSTVDSPTFGPWMLAPLMEISEVEAEKLLARLATYNLIEEVGGKNATGLKRYSLHSLVSLVARNELETAIPREVQRQATQAMYHAYLWAASRVLELPAPVESVESWNRFEPNWLPKVRQRLDHWVRAEYCNLLGAIGFACHIEAWDLSWRIAARLGACVTTELPPGRSITAFDDALAAADKAQSQVGRIEVLLARGSFLLAVERYSEAFADLREALEATDAAVLELSPLESRRLWASAHRRKAEGWMQLGAYSIASRELQIALAALKGLDDRAELSAEILRINLLSKANDTWCDPGKWLDREAWEKADNAYKDPPDDGIKFRAVLDLADQAQRRREWLTARNYLREASFENYGDDRRIANIQYRTARLLLSQGRDGPARDRKSLAREAVGYASDAVRIHRKMGNQVGIVRTEALLASALRLAGYRAAAAGLSDSIKSRLELFDSADPAWRALQARVQRCEGDTLFGQRDFAGASAVFSRAASLFADEGDWHSAAEVWLKVATTEVEREDWPQAMKALRVASGICTEHCRDEALKQDVEREKDRIRRLMVFFPV